MTDFFPSSPNLSQIGKKRGSSPFHSDVIEHSSQSSFKRQRTVDNQGIDEENKWGPNMVDHNQKRVRSEFNMRSNGPQLEDQQQQQQRQPQPQKNQYAALASLRSEFQSVVENKDAEIKALRERNFQLEAEFNRIEGSKKANEDENKLLKRAVAIQDGRQRELISQNQQLQQVLSQAAEHVANIERVNRQLRSQLELVNSPCTGYDNLNHRPPDVY